MIHHADCLDGMRGLDADSVDAIVTDPPYGLGFMGKKWDDPGALVERRADTSHKWDHVGGNHNPANSRDAARTRLSEGRKFQAWSTDWAIEALRVAKPGAHLLAFGGTRTFHRLACAIEDAGWEVRDCLSWLYGSGFPKSHNGPWGGTALKPAWEPIIMARKPLVGTVAANVAAHGTGALNVDGCRLDSVSETYPARRNARIFTTGSGGQDVQPHTQGRWPANVCLDEDAAAMLDEQSGERKSAPQGKGAAWDAYGGEFGFRAHAPSANYGDTGGASRFFYCAKASRSEREAGLEGMESRTKRILNGGIPSAVNSDPRGMSGGGDRHALNHHPTVKPIALMRWLCRLVTPPGGLVLDPFTGSGTTGCAAVLEGFRFVGFEREVEYVEIARRRIAHHAATVQPDLNPCA